MTNQRRKPSEESSLRLCRRRFRRQLSLHPRVRNCGGASVISLRVYVPFYPCAAGCNVGYLVGFSILYSILASTSNGSFCWARRHLLSFYFSFLIYVMWSWITFQTHPKKWWIMFPLSNHTFQRGIPLYRELKKIGPRTSSPSYRKLYDTPPWS